MNYNGYGGSEADLHFHPADLYREMAGFETPMAFLAAKPEVIQTLTEGYHNDFDLADQSEVCLLYTSPSPRDATLSRMPSSA